MGELECLLENAMKGVRSDDDNNMLSPMMREWKEGV